MICRSTVYTDERSSCGCDSRNNCFLSKKLWTDKDGKETSVATEIHVENTKKKMAEAVCPVRVRSIALWQEARTRPSS